MRSRRNRPAEAEMAGTGRRKVEIKRIADKSSRQVTFSKRRSGLIKKAHELAVLCDVEVALLVFSSRGKLYEFSSGNSLEDIIKRYRNHLGEAEVCKWGDETTKLRSAQPIELTCSELLHLIQRFLEGPECENLGVPDLVQLEKQLDVALRRTTSRKTELMLQTVTILHEQEATSIDPSNAHNQEVLASHETQRLHDDLAAKRQLSLKIDRLDSNLDECTQLTAATRDTVSDISAEVEKIGFNVTTVRNAVESLNITNVGILKLCVIASTWENRNAGHVQNLPTSSSRASIEAPPLTPSSKENDGAAEVNDLPSSRETSMGLQSPEFLSSNRSSFHEALSRRSSGGSASLFRRTSSIASSLLQQVLSSRQPC